MSRQRYSAAGWVWVRTCWAGACRTEDERYSRLRAIGVAEALGFIIFLDARCCPFPRCAAWSGCDEFTEPRGVSGFSLLSLGTILQTMAVATQLNVSLPLAGRRWGRAGTSVQVHPSSLGEASMNTARRGVAPLARELVALCGPIGYR